MNKTPGYIILLISFALLVLLGGCVNNATKAEPVNMTRIEWDSPPNVNSSFFDYADVPREFNFPADHGEHPNFQTEWWYFTGNLISDAGEDFGYQLTFFRRALAPVSEVQERTSDLAVNQIFMAHFTISDGRNSKFHPFERFSRGDGNLAGVSSDPLMDVWLEDWRVQQVSEDVFRLNAKSKNININLDLSDDGGIFLQGDNGWSRKSKDTASYYYSMPRLRTEGTISVDNENVHVSGLSWLDHEFSTSTLAADQVGWDWFALHLNNGKDIMAYTMRQDGGYIDPNSHGSIMEKDIPVIRLSFDDYEIIPMETWKSPISGALYPSGWRIRVPSQAIELTITPLIQNQELNLAFTYWEGAVKINGTVKGEPVSGSGYVELTGYAESMQGKF